VRVPADSEILAPEFPPRLDWLNVAFLRVDKLMGRNAILVEFWDFARVNSLRTLPYVQAWHARYAEMGLRVIGVHTPGYSFGRDRDTVAIAAERLGITHPVVLDPDQAVWRLYGNKGWPARYLFDRRGGLRQIHYGEGEYRDTELAIHEVLLEIDPDLEFPAPLDPIRLEDAPGVVMPAQTADVLLPRDRELVTLVRDWTNGPDYIEARDAGAAATVAYDAGAAYAVLSGDEVDPGVYETGGTVEAGSPGLRLHGFQFTPVPPADEV
jgi:hypothetical protein